MKGPSARTAARRGRAGQPRPPILAQGGTARVGVVWHLPEVLRELGVDPIEVLRDAGLRPDSFDDPDNRITYPQFAELLHACERRSGCDHVAFLIGQRTRLADLGLAGEIARCAGTVGEGLQNLSSDFNLQSSATAIALIHAAPSARLVYVITTPGLSLTWPFQLSAVAVTYNVLRELCGAAWRPTAITVASRAPQNLRPVRKFFEMPVQFDADESAVTFDDRWLARPLPAVDPDWRRQVEAKSRDELARLRTDLAGTVRRLLRLQLLLGERSMAKVAAMLGWHRRTLDRRLQACGVQYGELLESVMEDMARQLLRDTDQQVQQVADALHFSSAANLATAFRRWTGLTPSEFRRRSRRSARD